MANTLWNKLSLAKSPTTGVGSLPHHYVDAALEYAFRFDVPFLPQIPVRHPKEFMIVQALEGLPGLTTGEKGEATLNFQVWEKEASILDAKLIQAFKLAENDNNAFEAFEPGTDA